MAMGTEKHYLLLPKIKNEGGLIINNLKLLVDFPSGRQETLLPFLLAPQTL